jgi:hypothetical protein
LKLIIVAVGTVQEKVGLCGSSEAYQVALDYGFALKGTLTVDMPVTAPHMISAAMKKSARGTRDTLPIQEDTPAARATKRGSRAEPSPYPAGINTA